MLVIDKMHPETQISDIRSMFGRFGKIIRVIFDYQFDEDKVYCWLDYERQDSAEVCSC